jgi:hypothetical protein
VVVRILQRNRIGDTGTHIHTHTHTHTQREREREREREKHKERAAIYREELFHLIMK